MTVETFTPQKLFKPIGPYSHMAKAGSFIAISGTLGIDSATGKLADGAYAQAKQIIQNFRLMLREANCVLENVIHVNVYLKNVADFAEMNRAYEEEFQNHLPARTVIVVADLPKKDALMTMNLNAVCDF